MNTADQTAKAGFRTSTTIFLWLYWRDTPPMQSDQLCSIGADMMSATSLSISIYNILLYVHTGTWSVRSSQFTEQTKTKNEEQMKCKYVLPTQKKDSKSQPFFLLDFHAWIPCVEMGKFFNRIQFHARNEFLSIQFHARNEFLSMQFHARNEFLSMNST